MGAGGWDCSVMVIMPPGPVVPKLAAVIAPEAVREATPKLAFPSSVAFVSARHTDPLKISSPGLVGFPQNTTGLGADAPGVLVIGVTLLMSIVTPVLAWIGTSGPPLPD